MHDFFFLSKPTQQIVFTYLFIEILAQNANIGIKGAI